MQIQYLGGAQEVGRSCIAIHTEKDITMLDCGIKVKGYTFEETYPALNKLHNPHNLKRLLITHAHMDHSGAVPYLVKNYPNVKIYTTTPTSHIMSVLLQDNIKIQAEAENEIPVYDQTDLDLTLMKLNTQPYGEVNFDKSYRALLIRAGHIIGAAAIILTVNGKKILYTGDYTNANSALIKSQAFENFIIRNNIKIDLMITECTYGQKTENSDQNIEYVKLKNDILSVAGRGGKILIPSFALGRAQEIITRLNEDKDIDIPVFVDGMVRSVNSIYGYNYDYLHQKYHDKAKKFQNIFISDKVINVIDKQTRSKILKMNGPCIIVTSSGMLSGGPSVHYAKELMKHENNLIAIVGYQDEDSPGYALLNKTDEESYINFDGEPYLINCMVKKYSFSGHVSCSEIINTIKAINPKMVHLVHGDPDALIAAKSILDNLNINTVIPACSAMYEI